MQPRPPYNLRTVYEAFEAIRLVSNPSISKVLIRIRCAAFSCSVMIVTGTKALTLTGIEGEGGEG